MGNETIVTGGRALDFRLANSTICKYLPSQNSSLIAHWENIPETFLINGSIGIILFILFVIMTKIAWKRAANDDKFISQNLITFLYGYRDPELWYLIPRFEFLRHEDRHHKHDLKYPYIYLPPKLPLANPIEMFAYDSVSARTKSNESILNTRTKDSTVTISSKDKLPTNKQVAVKENNSQSDLSAERATKTDNPMSSNVVSMKKSESSLGLSKQTSFFYPSILSAEQAQATYLSQKLNSFFGMFFRVTDADIIYAKGLDAYEYLLFQRHLILIMLITNILCLGVILPIHWWSGSGLDVILTTSFQRSTIKNMGRENYFYWAHIICPSLIVLCSVYILNSYRNSIVTSSDSRVSRRTLLIGNIPREQRSRTQLSQVLQEYFPRATVEAIQFVYDTGDLDYHEQNLSCVTVARDYCLSYKQRYDQELMVHVTDVNQSRVCGGNCRICSFFTICCCYWPFESKEPGSTYYNKQEKLLRAEIGKTCEKLVKQPSEYAFVTFKSHRQAKKLMHQLTQYKLDALDDKITTSIFKSRKNSRRSVDSVESGAGITTIELAPSKENISKIIQANASESADPMDPNNDPHVRSIRSPIMVGKMAVGSLKTVKTSGNKSLGKLEGPIGWSVRYAPHPDNVGFSDLLNWVNSSKITSTLLHLLMIVIFIFITTPNVVLSIFERISVLQPEKIKQLTGFQGLMINYLSILLQIITTALLPALVTLISRQIPYEDTSSKDHSVMWKVYLFLVLMIIVMPSIGMSSAQALFNTNLATLDANCLFPTDNGAYFINYVISSIFLTTVLELIKPIDVLSYFFIKWTSRSEAEIEGGRQQIEREFSIALQHTSVLLIFSVVMTYAISCPLIAPVGLIYLLVKHAVDHYHLYYVYFTKKVDKNLQSTIVSFVKVALLLMLFQTTVAVRTSTSIIYITLPSQITFGITLAGFVFNCFFDCTSRAMPTSISKKGRFEREFCACYYLPRVFERLLKLGAIPNHCISRRIK